MVLVHAGTWKGFQQLVPHGPMKCATQQFPPLIPDIG